MKQSFEKDDIYSIRKGKKQKRMKIKRLKPFRGNVNQFSDVKSAQNNHRRKRAVVRDQRGRTDDIYVPQVFKSHTWWDCGPYKSTIYKRMY